MTNYRRRIREDFGMTNVRRLDKIIFDKTEIRDLLRKMTEKWEYVNQLSGVAKEVCELIDKFNTSIDAIHDMILPPRKAPGKKSPKPAPKSKRQ